MKKIALILLFGSPLLCSTGFAADTPYSNAVKGLSPSYYYELNETDPDAGVVDSAGTAEPGEFQGDYGTVDEGFAEAGCEGPLFTNEGQDGEGEFFYEEVAVPGVGGDSNVAHCSNNIGHIDLGPAADYGASAITVSMIFRHQGKGGTSGDRLFTNNLTDPTTSFQVNTAGQGLVIAVNPGEAGEFAERTLEAMNEPGLFDTALIDEEYGWFHVVASTSGAADERAENIQVWINGESRTLDLAVTEWGWGVDTSLAKIGGRREDPADSTTHIGAQDEVAIWLDRVLTNEEVQSLWTAAQSDVVGCTEGVGDFDGNGQVEFADFLVLSANFGKDGGAAEGDTDCNGKIEFADFLTLSANFGKTVGGAEAVPEPEAASLLLLGAMFIGMLRRRRN